MLTAQSEQSTVTISIANRAHSTMISLQICTVILFLNISIVICGTIPSTVEPALLVVSYDGFRPDYLSGKVTPNLNKFREDGTSAQFMMSVFPTKTLINHFTIASVSMQMNRTNTKNYQYCRCFSLSSNTGFIRGKSWCSIE